MARLRRALESDCHLSTKGHAVTDRLAQLYPQHVATVMARATHALERGRCDHLIVPSGAEVYRFLDDTHYPFATNPQFKAWLPLTQHPHCWLSFTPGRKPVLAYMLPADYWHLPPAPPSGWWVEHFDVRVIAEPQAAREHLPRDLSRAAILGDAGSAIDGVVPNNPAAVINSLDLARTRKTPYEVECMRRASLLGARAHRAAAAAYRDRRSEYEIHLAYIEGSGQTESELPYANIVALNEHCSTLHYQFQDRTRPREHLSLLIDAGAQVHGYAADITRTYGNTDPLFTQLLEGVSREQHALCAHVRPGTDWKALHVDTHRAMARVLKDTGIVRMEPESQLETGVSSVFFPHGLGHFIGLQVHDVGGFLADESGATIAKPDGHPYLRCTRVLEAGNAITVEPGVYFIDMLLAKLKDGPHAKAIDWEKVAHLKRFGGVRIEDDVVVTDGEPENLTRDAFRALAT